MGGGALGFLKLCSTKKDDKVFKLDFRLLYTALVYGKLRESPWSFIHPLIIVWPLILSLSLSIHLPIMKHALPTALASRSKNPSPTLINKTLQALTTTKSGFRCLMSTVTSARSGSLLGMVVSNSVGHMHHRSPLT